VAAGSTHRAFLCVGKDCRRHERHPDLLAELAAAAEVERVPCQDICKGPVAGVEVGGRIEWFKRLRKRRHRRALVDLARGGREVPEPLRERWVPKRGGRVPRGKVKGRGLAL
jgi:hypothetical protein